MWPFWFKLLEQRDRDGGFALTFPFLIGAICSATGAKTGQALYDSLLHLLESMRDETPEGAFVRISECDLLHQPIATKRMDLYAPDARFTPVPSPEHGRCSLFVEDKYIPDPARGLESVAETLWDLCSLAILKGRFTFKDGRYVYFGDEDREFISRATLIPATSDT
jgi:hypothetical protein